MKDNKGLYKKLFTIVAPIAFQYMMSSLVSASDAFMLGFLDQDSLSASSLAGQIAFVYSLFFGAFVAGCGVLAAQYWGKKDIASIEKIYGIALRFSLLFALLFFILAFFFPGTLMKLYTSDPDIVRLGARYLRIIAVTYLLQGFTQTYLAILRSMERMVLPAAAYISSLILNIVLNAVFIFGLFGVPAMDAKGAAIATLLARVIELLFCLIVSARDTYIRPALNRLFHRNRLLAQDFRKCCLPLVGGALFWGVGFTSYTAIVGHMGADAAAANSVSAVIRDLMCCLCNGISSAGGIMVGNELGAGDLKKGKLYGDRLMKMSYAVGIFSTLVVLAVVPLVLRYVVLTENAQYLLKGMLIIMAVYMIGRCVNTIIINGIFAAGGDTLFDMYSLAVCMWGIAIPTALIGAFWLHWPVLVVYACTCLDEVGKIPWVMIHYKKYKWVKNLTREEQI